MKEEIIDAIRAFLNTGGTVKLTEWGDGELCACPLTCLAKARGILPPGGFLDSPLASIFDFMESNDTWLKSINANREAFRKAAEALGASETWARSFVAGVEDSDRLDAATINEAFDLGRSVRAWLQAEYCREAD